MLDKCLLNKNNYSSAYIIVSSCHRKSYIQPSAITCPEKKGTLFIGIEKQYISTFKTL